MNKDQLAAALKSAGIEPSYDAAPDGGSNNVWYHTCHARGCEGKGLYLHETSSEPCDTGVIEHRQCFGCGRVYTFHIPFDDQKGQGQ